MKVGAAGKDFSRLLLKLVLAVLIFICAIHIIVASFAVAMGVLVVIFIISAWMGALD